MLESLSLAGHVSGILNENKQPMTPDLAKHLLQLLSSCSRRSRKLGAQTQTAAHHTGRMILQTSLPPPQQTQTLAPFSFRHTAQESLASPHPMLFITCSMTPANFSSVTQISQTSSRPNSIFTIFNGTYIQDIKLLFYFPLPPWTPSLFKFHGTLIYFLTPSDHL